MECSNNVFSKSWHCCSVTSLYCELSLRSSQPGSTTPLMLDANPRLAHPGSPSAHPAPALVARVQAGITSGPDRGELAADF